MRGNKHNLNLNHRKLFFTNRIIAIWNSLLDYVVDVNSITIFKNRLDKIIGASKILCLILSLR